MIISPGRNYIFVHIPKTGGTSLALALEDRAKKDDILIGDTPKAVRRRRRLEDVSTTGRLWKHSTLADIEGLRTIDEISEAFVFTLIRNPWDRMVSYYHWLREQHFPHPAVALAKASDFSAFLNDPTTCRSFEKQHFGHYMTATDQKEYCQLYIRLEHFEEDAAPLCAHLGFDLAIGVENRSNRRSDYRSYYSDADAERIGEVCRKDIERFGYLF